MNIIEYLFLWKVIWVGIIDRENLQQKKCGRKITAKKVRQKNCGRKTAAEKSRQKKWGKKIAAEKVRQKNCDRKSAAEKSRQQHGWGLFMRDIAHLVWGMFCELGFISWDGIGCSILLHISYLLKNRVGILHMDIGLLVVICC